MSKNHKIARLPLSRRAFALGLGATALIAAAARARAIEPSADTIRDLLRRRIDLDKRALGIAVGVVTAGRERVTTYGDERLGDDSPVTARTIFEIGSVTKVFTALLLADMAQTGLLDLNDPVERHLPGDMRLAAAEGRAVTLADLATHTSGLPRFPPFAGTRGTPQWVEAMARYGESEFKAWLSEFQPSRVAGSAWEYSNAGYALLGMALAHRGGQAFETLLSRRVIEPLGLRETLFRPTVAMAARVAEGHAPDLQPLPAFEGGIFAAAGALRSSAKDMVRFAGKLLSRSSSIGRANALLLTIQRPAQWIAGRQALGWEVLDTPGGAIIGKDGVTFGQAASLMLDPDAGEAVVVLSNTHPDLSASTPSGGGIGAADLARHLLRPRIPMNGEGGVLY